MFIIVKWLYHDYICRKKAHTHKSLHTHTKKITKIKMSQFLCHRKLRYVSAFWQSCPEKHIIIIRYIQLYNHIPRDWGYIMYITVTGHCVYFNKLNIKSNKQYLCIMQCLFGSFVCGDKTHKSNTESLFCGIYNNIKVKFWLLFNVSSSRKLLQNT